MAGPSTVGGLTGVAQWPDPAPPTKENPSCFGVLMTAASEVSSLRARVESLVDRLCGSVPTGESVSGEGLPSPGMGLLPIADRRCRDVLGDVNAAHAALDRLEKSLP